MRTIKQAEKECRTAWALRPDAKYGWCIHHGQEWEELTEPIENRIDYILSYKAKEEQVTRLDNMRPMSEVSVKVILKAWKAYDETAATARKAYNETIALEHKNDIPNHTWNGSNIF